MPSKTDKTNKTQRPIQQCLIHEMDLKQQTSNPMRRTNRKHKLKKSIMPNGVKQFHPLPHSGILKCPPLTPLMLLWWNVLLNMKQVMTKTPTLSPIQLFNYFKTVRSSFTRRIYSTLIRQPGDRDSVRNLY